MERGLVLVNTGNGKGKTTAALGVALRAFGNGQRVLIMQFIKGGRKYGELEGIGQLGEGIEIRQLGDGFVRHHRKRNDEAHFERHRAKAQAAWEEVKKEVASDQWDLIVLDEINYAVDFGLLDVEDVVTLLKEKPIRLNLILTGRNVRSEVVELADTVTEMNPIKHAHEKGIPARRGIEY